MDFSLNIDRINGVDQYIIVDNLGNIMARNIKEIENIAQLVYSCGRSLEAMGKKNFLYAVFLRKNNKNLLIFPVGNYYLGVVKQKSMDNAQLAETVVKFLNTTLLKKGNRG